MRAVIVFFAFLFVVSSVPLKTGNDFCGVSNTAVKAGEALTYKVYYTIAGAYIGVGEAVFSYTLQELNNKVVYHAIAEGKTYSFYDKIYKVRDRYESYLDTGTLQSYKFIRTVSEGNYKIYENTAFLKDVGTAVTKDGVYKVPSCVQDVMSAITFTRNLDFTHLKVNDNIPFDMFLDKEVHHLSIRYLGKETIRTKYAKFRAIRLSASVIKSNIFSGDEKMTVWISDDPNHVALRVQSPILIGKVKIDMVDCKNLRYPLSSLIDF